MANSSIVRKAKNKIIKEFIKNQNIVAAINSSEISPSEPQKLLYKHIFDYHQNPHTLKIVGTFITIQVHIPENFYRDYHGNSTIHVKPTIEIWIISHENHMRVDNIPKVTQNRNDYLAEEIKVLEKGEYSIVVSWEDAEIVLESFEDNEEFEIEELENGMFAILPTLCIKKARKEFDGLPKAV